MSRERTYDYRLYPTATQGTLLMLTCESLRELYNAGLQERIEAWSKQAVRVTERMQSAQLPDIRRMRPSYAAISAQVMQDAIGRLEHAFQDFWRRCAAGMKPKYPRFRGHGRYRSFTFPQAGKNNGVGLVASGRRLRIHGIGSVKIKLHRPYEGMLKQVRILRRGDGHWYAQFICVDAPAKLLPKSSREVGIDVGIKHFLASSDGEVVPNPRFYESTQKALAVAQRKLSGRQRHSNRSRKQKRLVARTHLRVARQRRDFQHKLALKLVKENDLIAVEDLNVKGLAQGRLSKQIHDAGWSQFIDILAYKAESAGREMVKVNPSGTSQVCSSCGEVVPKDLSVRVHRCVSCGYQADRDVNAAKNILRLGQSLREARRSA